MNCFQRIYEVVKTIPYGKTMNYGTVAKLAGFINGSRQVGWALHVNPDPSSIPCHRVVKKNGGLSGAFAFGGIEEHKRRLEAEGVKIVDYKVLEEYIIIL